MRIQHTLAQAVAVAALAVMPVACAQAALPEGAAAPDFRTQGALGGRVFNLRLRDELRRGPVVLYFFPKAFTPGCTVETRAFADAIPQFRAAGARVIGMSGDTVADLQRFSIEACRSLFPVASAGPRIISGYQVGLTQRAGMTNRTSYVIGQDGRIAFVHSDMSPTDHVRLTLAAVQRLQAQASAAASAPAR